VSARASLSQSAITRCDNLFKSSHSSGGENRLQYRVYLLNSEGRIAAAESFYATGDEEALGIAFDLYNLSSDAVDGYELWRGAVRLTAASNQPQQAYLNREDTIISRQERMLELEERLWRSFVCIRESRRLLEAMTDLRDRPPRQTSATDLRDRPLESPCFGPGPASFCFGTNQEYVNTDLV
jgi:hypothetical protein